MNFPELKTNDEILLKCKIEEVFDEKVDVRLPNDDFLRLFRIDAERLLVPTAELIPEPKFKKGQLVRSKLNIEAKFQIDAVVFDLEYRKITYSSRMGIPESFHNYPEEDLEEFNCKEDFVAKELRKMLDLLKSNEYVSTEVTIEKIQNLIKQEYGD